MNDITRITSVQPVLYGVVKVVWDDGYEGIVDLRPVIETGSMFSFLADPARFSDVRRGDYGHTIYWLDDDGDEIDFGSDSLRERAKRQAEILRLAS